MTKEQFLSKSYKSEDKFTQDTYMYVNNNYPQSRGFFFHVPNEGMNMMERIKKAAMGVVPGIPDMVCMHPVFGMELKLPGKKQSEKQVKIQSRWDKSGVPYHLCDTPEKVVEVIEYYFGEINT